MARRLAPVLAAVAVLGLAAPGAAADEALARAFASADLNGDGFLDIDEYAAAVIARFFEHDANGDRFLTPDEVPEADPADFAEADRGGDGRISLGEAVGDRMIRFFDAGGREPPHGVVTLEELKAYEAGRS
ncbi:MAG: hypothetical protein AAF763_03835 [Pseudomonadota bacterium]